MPILPEEVTTPRLVLRQWSLDDVAALQLAVARNLEHLRPWMPWIAAEPLGLDHRRTLITGWAEARATGGDAVYGIFLADGTAIGGTGLHRRLGRDGLEIGYWVDLEHVGRGFASEAAAALTDAALAIPGIARVEIHVDVANHPSNAVARRLGFELAGTVPVDPVAPAETGRRNVWRRCEPLGAAPVP